MGLMCTKSVARDPDIFPDSHIDGKFMGTSKEQWDGVPKIRACGTMGQACEPVSEAQEQPTRDKEMLSALDQAMESLQASALESQVIEA